MKTSSNYHIVSLKNSLTLPEKNDQMISVSLLLVPQNSVALESDGKIVLNALSHPNSHKLMEKNSESL